MSDRAKSISDKLVRHFKYLIAIYTKAYPASEIEFRKSYAITYRTYLKAWFGILYLFFLKIGQRKRFFFESFRNRELIDLLNPAEVIIIGGREDMALCRQKKLGFLWTGGIVAAILLAAQRDKPRSLQLHIDLLKKKISCQKRFLFLFEDTVPVGLFFCLLGNSFDHPTVYVQHGFPTGEEILLDGTLTRYNILYSMAQVSIIRNFSCTSFELGPPFDIHYGNDISKEVILVGTGGKGYLPDLYLDELTIYSRIEQILLQNGWQVMYRPHPNEDPDDYNKRFNKIDSRNKIELLSDSKKILIGYVSTLLYEAQIYGHGIINLCDPRQFKLTYEPDFMIETNDVSNVNLGVEAVYQKLLRASPKRIEPLKQRFFRIIRDILKAENSDLGIGESKKGDESSMENKSKEKMIV